MQPRERQIWNTTVFSIRPIGQPGPDADAAHIVTKLDVVTAEANWTAPAWLDVDLLVDELRSPAVRDTVDRFMRFMRYSSGGSLIVSGVQRQEAWQVWFATWMDCGLGFAGLLTFRSAEMLLVPHSG